MALTYEDEGHVYRIGKRVIPSVTTILKATGGLYDGYSDIPRDTMIAAGLRGDAVHAAVDHYHKTGAWSIAPPEIEPHLEAYRRFENDTGFVCHASEARLYCPRLFFAGTLDDVGDIYAEPGIVDLKSTAELNIPATRIQTAAYRWLWTVNEMEPFVPPENRFALHLKRDGKYRLEQFDKTYSEDIAEFIDRYRRYRDQEEGTEWRQIK